MKQTHLKIWPEIVNYQPAIIPFDKTNDQKENSVHIDFCNCNKVDSAGLTLLIVNLIKIFKKRSMLWPATKQLIHLFREIALPRNLPRLMRRAMTDA